MNSNQIAALRTIAAEAASSKIGAAHITPFHRPMAMALIHLGMLGIQRAPLNGPDLYCYPSTAGLAAL